jgi:peptidoglycan/LPS O-acetylase OafA/YrhL
LQSAGWIPWTIVYALVCVAAAVALHFAIERPFLKLRKRLDWQPRRTTEWPA